MPSKWVRYQKWCVVLSTGVTLGVLQGLSMVNFAQLFSQLLSSWLSILVTVLLGGNANNLLQQITA